MRALHSTFHVSVAVCAAVAFSAWVDVRSEAADTPPRIPAEREASVDEAVVDFVKKTAHGRLATIELARIAQDRPASSSIATFAKGMLGQESLLLERLEALAAKLGLKLPVAPTEKSAEKLGRIQAKSQHDFEKSFWDFVSDTYERDVVTFEFASAVPNDDVREFALQYRDMFQRQLDEIKTKTQSESAEPAQAAPSSPPPTP